MSSAAWLARLPLTDRDTAVALRLFAGVEQCVAEPWLWLRGPRWDADVERLARHVPGLEHCSGTPDGPATVRGRGLPSGRVPVDGWQPLRAATAPTAPAVAFPGRLAAALGLTLVRCADEQPCALLRCAWADFAAWAEDAPEHRLGCLRFVVDDAGGALVSGDPLPPIPGGRHWRCGPLALPAGWTCHPAVDPTVAAVLCASGPADVVLAAADGGWDLVPAAAWVVASRSAVRLSGSDGVPWATGVAAHG